MAFEDDIVGRIDWKLSSWSEAKDLLPGRVLSIRSFASLQDDMCVFVVEVQLNGKDVS
jgi:hypothetical protein